MKRIQTAHFDLILEIRNHPKALEEIVVTGSQIQEIIREARLRAISDPNGTLRPSYWSLEDLLGGDPRLTGILPDEEVTLTRN